MKKKINNTQKSKINNTKKDWFKWVVLAVVLIIPFMYSFFYLKAYWNPYGKGNIDNIPVAIVNEDTGKNGTKLINSIKDSKKLKISVISSSEAEDGLYDGDYYAVINIPKNFTSNMESAATTNKKHATITYSPNQKSNYLASQIINSAVNTVEKNLDNQVNSQIVSNLSEQIETIPGSLNTISTGFGKLQNGTEQLKSGSTTLTNGTANLNSNYTTFNNGVLNVKNGTSTLNSSIKQLDGGIATLESSTKEFNTLSNSLDELGSGVGQLKTGSDKFTVGLDSYVDSVKKILTMAQGNGSVLTMKISQLKPYLCTGMDSSQCDTLYPSSTDNLTLVQLLSISGDSLKAGNNEVNSGINTLSAKASGLVSAKGKILELQSGIAELKSGSSKMVAGANTLNTGVNTLFTSSNMILSGINTLDNGSKSLSNGITTLNNSVISAKNELDTNISSTNKSVKKVEKLSDYSKQPVNVETKEVNKVPSYGTAFAPFFISIGLWVGCLMLFIILYYDKQSRFGILDIKDERRVGRTLCYHGLVTLSAVVLGLLLMWLLDFKITNIGLYFLAIVLTGNAFLAIIEFLIVNLKDIGKFIALILLVLQLAAAGGTFPIETVTKGFRWMNNFLPMKYTIGLLRETLVSIQDKLLTKNLIIVFMIFIVFFIINIGSDIIRNKKSLNK